MDNHTLITNPTLEEVLDVDSKVREVIYGKWDK